MKLSSKNIQWKKLSDFFLGRKLLNQTNLSKKPFCFDFNSDYSYLVSFYKSGNTWVRFLIANAICEEDELITFQKLAEFIPGSQRSKDCRFIYESHSRFHQLPFQLVKSHSFVTQKIHNVIYLVRDGRDAITSYYYWINARVQVPISLSDIICGHSDAGSWSDHVLGWFNVDCRKKLIVKYEDILVNPVQELQKILKFLEVEVSPQRVHQAVERSSFENLRRIEEAYGIFDGKVEASKKVPFIRQGKCGDWKNLFLPEDSELFWRYHREAMEKMNYRE